MQDGLDIEALAEKAFNHRINQLSRRPTNISWDPFQDSFKDFNNDLISQKLNSSEEVVKKIQIYIDDLGKF